MTIDEALDYIEDINSTVSWTKEQETDREFFENVAEWLEELKRLRLGVNYLNEKAYQQGRADGIDELENILKDFFKKQNNQKSKFRPSIVMMEEDALNILEQLKEQTE